jgi:hypothetical protein
MKKKNKKFSTEYTNILGFTCCGVIEAESWETAERIANEKPMKEVITGEIVEEIEVDDELLSAIQN